VRLPEPVDAADDAAPPPPQTGGGTAVSGLLRVE
jgi:hypothetical protein